MVHPALDPVAHSLLWSALTATLPLIVFFVLLGAVRLAAPVAALCSLAAALIVAVAGFGMPLGPALDSAAEGAVFGVFPILWIVANALWIHRMTVDQGAFDVLRGSFGRISPDHRIQALVVAFCFGALLEGLAGFGAPVAVTSVLLISLGFRPMKAAVVALVANTAPVAFGAIAVPVITLAELTGLPLHQVASTVGRQTPVLALVVPLLLVALVDGRRGLRETWRPALICGVAFAAAQFACSNFVSVELSDIIASLVALAAVVLTVRAGRPAAPAGDTPDSRAAVARAYAPYAIVIAVFGLSQIPAVKDWLAGGAVAFNWPGLHVANPGSSDPNPAVAFNFNWAPAAGTLLLLAGLITAAVLKLSPRTALRAYGATVLQLRSAILTVMAVLALAYVMNLSGQTAALGHGIARAGGALAFLAPVLGWLGTAISGSDTSANALFGTLQTAAAKGAGLPPHLLAAANSSGGVLGKMISPQNLAIAAAATGMDGREGEILRKVLGWSAAMLAVMCILVYLQSTPVLNWMIP